MHVFLVCIIIPMPQLYQTGLGKSLEDSKAWQMDVELKTAPKPEEAIVIFLGCRSDLKWLIRSFPPLSGRVWKKKEAKGVTKSC